MHVLLNLGNSQGIFERRHLLEDTISRIYLSYDADYPCMEGRIARPPETLHQDKLILFRLSE